MEFSREERLDSATVSERERSLALALLSADGSAEYAHHFMGWTLQRKDGKLQQRVLVVGQFRLSTLRKARFTAKGRSKLAISKHFPFLQLRKVRCSVDAPTGDANLALTFRLDDGSTYDLAFLTPSAETILEPLVRLARAAQAALPESMAFSLDLHATAPGAAAASSGAAAAAAAGSACPECGWGGEPGASECVRCGAPAVDLRAKPEAFLSSLAALRDKGAARSKGTDHVLFHYLRTCLHGSDGIEGLAAMRLTAAAGADYDDGLGLEVPEARRNPFLSPLHKPYCTVTQAAIALRPGALLDVNAAYGALLRKQNVAVAAKQGNAKRWAGTSVAPLVDDEIGALAEALAHSAHFEGLAADNVVLGDEAAAALLAALFTGDMGAGLISLTLRGAGLGAAALARLPQLLAARRHRLDVLRQAALLPKQGGDAQQLPSAAAHVGELATMRTGNVLKYSVGQEVHNMGAHGISGVIESLVADDAGTGAARDIGPGVIAIRRCGEAPPAAQLALKCVLAHLDLSGNPRLGASTEGSTALVAAVAALSPALRFLSLARCGLSKDCSRQLLGSACLAGCALVRLNLSANAVSSTALGAWLAQNGGSLKELHAAMCGGLQTAKVVDAILGNGSLLADATEISGGGIESLSLSGNDIGAGAGAGAGSAKAVRGASAALAQLCARSAALRWLQLAGMELRNKSLVALLEGMEQNEPAGSDEAHSAQTLLLHDNDFSSPSGASEKAVMRRPWRLLPGCGQMISVLDVSDCRIGVDGMADLAAAAAQCPALTRLRASRNIGAGACGGSSGNAAGRASARLGDALVALIEAEGSALAELELAGDFPAPGRFGTRGPALLLMLEALQNNTALERLDISGNDAGNEAAVFLARTLALNASLTDVSIDGNHTKVRAASVRSP